ncbi:hypothetical protein F2Q69_00051183 [Brassica cretica]|uniref:Leucine-rich repeat-containing N-terminal plant-type domain-containing protein n=1 Tax=Brassica cretica TaxID=69181 RepID=A0A8S9PLZ5_BRACR|nr:hypothetical protein F2Q69_00051183 [Brassica cretica]
MSLITLVATCLWFLLVSSFSGANEANVNCLRSIQSQVKDPNGYLLSWVFGNETAGYICKFAGVTCWHDDENRVLSIKLSGFGLGGEFPLGIYNCTDLVVLDLSYNQFSGEIPASLPNINFLNTLMLQHNQFTGQLPPELASLRRLKQFSVAYNHLTRPVPEFNNSSIFGLESFANNKGLCGPPMDYCTEPEEEMIRFGMIGAAVSAAVFAPLGVFLDWFFNGRKEKQGNIRHRS